MTTKLFARSFLSLFLIVSISLMNVNVVLADDPIPPTATAEPTQEPTEEATQPGEELVEPVATETPTVSDASIGGDQPPAEGEPPISDLLAQLPEETSLVVLDENGNPVPLASQDAAEIVLEADPIWCPATAPSPTPNSGGCTDDFATPAELLAFLQANQGNALYQQAGIIYLESATVVNVPVFIDAALFPTLKNFSLTVKGGWNNVNDAPAGNTSTFDNNNDAYLHIGSSSNPWVGNVTIQDIFIQDNTVNDIPSIEVYTTNGSVTLNNVDTDDIDDATAINVVVSGTGSVTLTDVDVSDGTDGSGIIVTTNSGNINLADVDVTNQSDGYTANLQSQSGNITITNGSSFDGDNTGDINLGFNASTNTGSITITGADASPITFSDAEGNGSGTNYNGATLSAPVVTLTNVTAIDNDLNGIYIINADTVTLNNVIGGNNSEGNGTNPPGANNSVGSGVYIQGPAGGTTVNIDGGLFANNERYGIEIHNGSVVIISQPTYGIGSDRNGIGTIGPNTAPALNMPVNMTVEATSSAGAVVNFTVTATDTEDNPDPIPTCNLPSGSVFPIATTTVTCSVTDSFGVSMTDTFTVQVRDTSGPILTLPANIVDEATSPSGKVVTFTVIAVDLVDGARTVLCIPGSGSNFGFGTTTVNCLTNDSRFNFSSGSFTVTIQDTTPPTLNLPANIVVEATDSSGNVVTYSASATDLVDGSRPITCTPASNSIFPVGVTTVNCSASDTRGNTANGSFTATVQDMTPPTLSLPANITMEATSASGAVAIFTASSTDIVDTTVPVVCSPASGSTFPLGTTSVNCSTTDSHSNSTSGSFTVTVQDTTAPVIAAHPGITEEATSAAGTVVNYTSPSTSDAFDGVSIATCSPASGSNFVFGDTTVTCNATDSNGNVSTPTTFTVTVQDTTRPALSLSANITEEAISATGALVTYSVSASDVVDGVLSVTCSPASGGIFAMGMTTVNCSATDTNNNSTSGSFTITVQDTTPPVIAPKADIYYSIQSIFGSKDVFFDLPSTTDAVDGIGTAACSPVPGSPFKVGDWTVTCTATDSHGNVAAPITFMVHIKHEPASQPGSAIIPVTGEETIDLDCNTKVMLGGIKVIFYNLCDQQAMLSLLDASTLPGALPAGFKFVKGLNITTLNQGQVLDALPAGAGIEMDFPASNSGQFAVLFWNDGQWVEITQSINEADLVMVLNNDASNELYKIVSSENGKFKTLTTENTGTFVLVKK